MSTQSPEPSTGSADTPQAPLLSARTVRLLKLSIVIMTLLIAAGLIALVFGMKRQMNILADKPPVAVSLDVNLPGGAVLQSVAAADDTGSLWLHIKTAAGADQLMLLNTKGQLVKTVRLNQAK